MILCIFEGGFGGEAEVIPSLETAGKRPDAH
jgi:hypothetical protein